MTRNIKLRVAYDGTDFCGSQIQPNGRTVQEELEKALEKMHKQKVPAVFSGRTDSGVHAEAQVVNFHSPLQSIPVEKYARALNSLLPADLVVLDSVLVSDDFHARFSACMREYRYYFKCSDFLLPREHKYIYRLSRPVSMPLLNELGAVLIGEHDFTSFCALNDPNPTKIRYIENLCFYPKEDGIVLKIRGNAFLWRQVRTIVGTILELFYDGKNAQDMKNILEQKNREAAGTTAPPWGLFLHAIEYPEEYR